MSSYRRFICYRSRGETVLCSKSIHEWSRSPRVWRLRKTKSLLLRDSCIRRAPVSCSQRTCLWRRRNGAHILFPVSKRITVRGHLSTLDLSSLLCLTFRNLSLNRKPIRVSHYLLSSIHYDLCLLSLRNIVIGHPAKLLTTSLNRWILGYHS